jgi:hypothetical protein
VYRLVTSTTSGRASVEPPSQEPTCIKGYENNDACGKFNTQNNPLGLSGLDIKPPRIFGCLVFSPLRECYVKIPSMDEAGRADSHNQCQHCSYGELAGESGHAKEV